MLHRLQLPGKLLITNKATTDYVKFNHQIPAFHPHLHFPVHMLYVKKCVYKIKHI